MTIGSWLGAAQKRLTAVGITSGRLDSLLLAEHVTSLSREHLLAHPEMPLDKSATTELDKLLGQRADRIPLVHLTNRRQFYGLEFEITPDVLTPRAETERMVELALEKTPHSGSLLDLGTGSGAVAVAVAHLRPDLVVTATDISPAALKVAHRNAQRYDLKIAFTQSDLFGALAGRFNTITANLPYLRKDAEVMPEVKREPAVALFGGADGLELYRRFFAQAPDHLVAGGLVIIEADPWQHPPLIKLARDRGFEPIDQDYFILSFKLAK